MSIINIPVTMSSYTGSTQSSLANPYHSDSDNDTPLARRSPEFQSFSDHQHRGRYQRHLSPDDDLDDDYARSPSLSSVHQFPFHQRSHIPSQRISERSLSRQRCSTVDSADSEHEDSSNALESMASDAINSVRISGSTPGSWWIQRDRLQAIEPRPMDGNVLHPRHNSVPDENLYGYDYQMPSMHSRYTGHDSTFPHAAYLRHSPPGAGGQQLPSLSSVVGDVLPRPITSAVISSRHRSSVASAVSIDSSIYSNSPPAYSVVSAASSSIYQLSSSQPTMHSYDHGPAGYDMPYKSRHSPDGSVSSAKAEYRCPHKDCNVPPFTTQYLLNSHLNVHSSSRPHYCPHPGCPRGEGGEGFKRKNEMVRHSHIHMAPKYQCPFCKDHERKYPRPDNLQRHVRSRHPERSMDDPDLREVLSHRPDGHKKGRRRRTVHGV